MIRKKRTLWISAGVVITLILSLLGYYLSGSTAVESWVGSQLLNMGGTYLEPELRFDRLTYVRPRTILLDHLTLSSPDPAHPGTSVAILAVKRARLELTEIPRRGQPIRFSHIILESPEIHALAAAPGNTGLVGFSHLLKSSTDTQTATSSAPVKLSDILLIRQVQIIDGSISFDPRQPDLHPIWLDGINGRLDFTPAGTSSNPGLYAIATTISRKPALALSLQGQVDIDTLTLNLAALDLTLDLQQKNTHVLPPELQTLLRTYEVTGQLHLTASGTLPLTDWRQCTLQSKGQLTAAQVAAGSNRLAIDSCAWELDLADSVAAIQKADVRLLGGELHVTGTIPLDSTRPARLRLSASDLRIQQFLRSPKPGELPPYAGNLDAAITFSAPLARWKTQAAGGGTLRVRQGRIDGIPLLDHIVADVGKSLSKKAATKPRALTDTADATFTLAGNRIEFDQFTATSGILALRGNGAVNFDTRLDLRINGGPMEKLQNSLGVIGEMWANVSDDMAGYRVRGTLDHPQVSMELGGGP